MKINRTCPLPPRSSGSSKDFRTATRRNLGSVLKGFMVISQGRRIVSIPDRGNSKDRGTEARNSLVVCASYNNIGKGKLQ